MNTETKESKKPRLIFLDNIKLLFVILVIFQHARVTYEGSGWWYYVESNPVDALSFIFFFPLVLVGGLFQSSLMGLFFLMGGYLTPKSYDRKGVKLFWRERLLRLGIPLLLYIVLINPILAYILANLGIEPWSTYPTLQGSFLDYYLIRFQSLESIVDFLTFMGPMWFLWVLLLFSAGYTLWCQIIKVNSIQKYIPKDFSTPRYSYLLLIAIILGSVTFLFRLIVPIDEFPLQIPFAFITQYAMMFSVGAIAVRYNWFEEMSKEHIKVWSMIIISTIVFLFMSIFAYFAVLQIEPNLDILVGGFTFPALVFAFGDNIICMGMIFILIPIFKAKFNDQGPLLQNLSASSFHMYLVHAPTLLLVSLVFASITLFPVVKLAMVFPLTVILCYLASHYVLKKIL
jgi:hypothetical protein